LTSSGAPVIEYLQKRFFITGHLSAMSTRPSHEPRDLSACLYLLEHSRPFEPEKADAKILLGGYSTVEQFEGKVTG
jgi:hypothetical protein